VKTAETADTLEFLRAHVVEFGSHSGVVANVVLLFQDAVPTTLHMRFLYGVDWGSELGNFRGRAKVHVAFRNRYIASLKFYIGVFLSVRKKDLIWISTGPEHRVVPDVLFLGLLLLFFRKRLVLSIRDANNWMAGYPGTAVSRFTLALRRFYLKHVRRLVFETKAQERLFSLYYPSLPALRSHCPTMFSDGGSLWELGIGIQSGAISPTRPTLRVGLVGAVDPTRRDYVQLMAAICAVQEKLLRPVELVVLGNAGGPGAKRTLEELRAVALVESVEGFLPQRDLILKSRSCAFLLAPLMADKSYGSTRGTGVFGDAILSGVNVVVPAFVDPGREFAAVCITYDDQEGLQKIFLEAGASGGPQTIDQHVLESFSSAALQTFLFDRLRLDARRY
jgi:hypothetical protein